MSDVIRAGGVDAIYPERQESRLGKRDKFMATAMGVFAAWIRPRTKEFEPIVAAVGAHGPAMEALSDAQLFDTAQQLRRRLSAEGLTIDAVSPAFALIREAARRTIGLRHFDTQLIGGWVMLRAMVAEMETGEGKTLTATLTAGTLALAGVPVHVITVNDYLAQRDAEMMGPIYKAIGVTVGTVVHGMDPAARRRAYRCDVAYCTNKEITFDYLRDRIVLRDRPTPLRFQVERLFGQRGRLGQLLLRGLHFAIVDEADSVLVDEARTPLIISAQGRDGYDPAVFQAAMDLARTLDPQNDFRVLENERQIHLSASGKMRAHAFDWDRIGFRFAPEVREELVGQALSALHLFHLDQHYLIKDGKIEIIDEFTGRLMADRSWERGLHQLIEIKEGCQVTQRKETLARISYQRFFRRYLGLSGMTGTAREVAGELWSIYRLKVVTIPTHRPMRRHFRPDRILPTEVLKWAAVVETIEHLHRHGRPVLVGTRSVKASEQLSAHLTAAGLPHRVLNARQDKEEADIIVQAGQPGTITVATNMAGRGTDIRLGKGVAEKGGLYVIATERHEAGRIDRQLFGRCGRQGDPGTCQAMVSIDDELVTTYTGAGVRWLARRLVGHPGRLPAMGAAAVLFRMAQKRAERIHARMRYDLLEYDAQLGETLAFSGPFE
jgi:preprotein translocase subunit SecA